MAGITSAGFVRRLEADLIDEMVAEGRATIDPNLDDSPDSVSGQIFAIVGSKHAELWEVLEAVYGALGENATGANLDRIAALTNTFRVANENDAAFRIRRRTELSDQGATTEGAMRAALSKLTGMRAVRVVSNRSMTTDTAGRPPKSVEAIVLGTATTGAIAETIWTNLAAGIATYGTATPTAITDSEGHTQPILYSVGAPANWYAKITVEVDEGSFAGESVLKQRVADFTSGAISLSMSDGSVIAGGVDIGGTLWKSRISAAALSVAGVTAVRRVEFKATEAGEWQDVDLPLGPRQYLGLDEDHRGFQVDHITVVPT